MPLQVDSCSPEQSKEQRRSLGSRADQTVTRLDTELSSPRSVWMPQCTPILPQSLAVLGPSWSLISTRGGHSQEQGEQQMLMIPALLSTAPLSSTSSSRIAKDLT